MDCIDKYDPTIIITDYSLSRLRSSVKSSPAVPSPSPITNHRSPILTAEDTVIFTTKSTKEEQKTQRKGRFEIYDSSIQLMLVFLKDLTDHQLGRRGLKGILIFD